MNDKVQPEAGGSRGCLFAALGAGCLVFILIIGAGASLFLLGSRAQMMTGPMRSPIMNTGEFPTDIVSQANSAEAAFHLYSKDGDRRADFGMIRLEWPGRGGNFGSTGSTITLAQPANYSGMSSFSSGSTVKVTTRNGITKGKIYEASFVIDQGMLSLDGQAFDAINGPPTVIVLDKAGKITETRLYEAPVPVVEEDKKDEGKKGEDKKGEAAPPPIDKEK